MIQKLIKASTSIAFLIFSIIILDNPIGTVPPIGKFLNPFSGYAALVNTDTLPTKKLHFDKLIDKEDDEILTLESLANDPNQYSRLSCQIVFKKEYENITFTIASD